MNDPTNTDPVVQAFDNWSGWQLMDKAGEGPMLQCFRAGWQASADFWAQANGKKKTGIFHQSIDELKLSVRAYNSLKNANLLTVGDIAQETEEQLLKTKGFGRKSLREIKEILSSKGLELGLSHDARCYSNTQNEKEKR